MKNSEKILLFDIGNTHTHVGLADGERVVRSADIPTLAWFGGSAGTRVQTFIGRHKITGAVLCSVVPRATPLAKRFVRTAWKIEVLELTPATLRGVGIDYPKPSSIGPDRLANAVAARIHFGAPVVVVDFGTAVTFDVVNAEGNYAGGIIAPGLAAMTDYLHEKTALLPQIKIRDIKTSIGKSTEEAMLVGAVQGYRGLVRELIGNLKRELRAKKLPVVATGGYAKLIAAKMPEISQVAPELTLEGLRLVWQKNHA
ncbi:MAG TPA: type III pantothenate kinase [Candidatus Sulfotelmatobacter sp.]|jgi:type III pantothenate kinase|nr:type III pantothenate kinase [Candidatus Sulfotelmatobacter sp.]